MTGVAAEGGCDIVIADTTLSWRSDAIVEELALEVRPDPSCGALILDLPPGVGWQGGRGRIRVVDGRDAPLDASRLQVRDVDARGHRAVRVELADLSADDRANLSIVRSWPGGYVWAPQGVGWAGLRGPEATETTGAVRRGPRGLLWAEEPGADLRVVVGQPAIEAPTQAAERLRQSRTLTLRIPPGDPQERLFPGGGSSVLTDLHLTLKPRDDVPTQWWVALPEAASPGEVRVEPPGAATVDWADGAAHVALRPGEAIVRLLLRWEAPDAPTYGVRPPDEDFEVRAEAGAVAWDGPDTWYLREVRGTEVLPDREALVEALGWRFFVASLPEPSAPLGLRGAARDEALVQALLPALWRQAVVVDTLPGDPLMPRRLRAALRSRVLRPLEACLIVAAWARQLGLDAVAVPVAPFGGPAGQIGPAGHTDALVRIVLDGVTQWLDPACGSCGPGQYRPELGGAPVLGPEQAPVLSGTSAVEVLDDGLRWTLTGAAALELRRTIERRAAHDRSRFLAEGLAGPGAELVTAHGVGEAGADIILTVRGGAGPVYDPTAVDPLSPVLWVGSRSFQGPEGLRLASPTREAR